MPGLLTVYVLGPGVGESQIVVMPDSRIVVVDSCARGGVNLTAALLDSLAISRVDLLVMTHPDLDHIRGFKELVDRFSPATVWRPALDLERELVMAALEEEPDNGRLADLREAWESLSEHLSATGRVVVANVSTKPWTPAGSTYAVHCLAPTHFDQARGREVATGLLSMKRGEWALSEAFRRRLDGQGALRVRANALSLGVVLEWEMHRVLLAGDMENGTASPHSGWKGVLRFLDEEGSSGLVTDLSAIKVAHHGSSGAFHEPAWRLHARSSRPVGLIAPFSPSSLPDGALLAALRNRCGKLGLTADPGEIVERAVAAGWKRDATAPTPYGDGALVMATLALDGTVTLRRAPLAHTFD